MKKTNDFAWYISLFFSKYLPGQRNLSSNTIASYRDTFKLFLVFCDDAKGLKPEKVTLNSVTRGQLLSFLNG